MNKLGQNYLGRTGAIFTIVRDLHVTRLREKYGHKKAKNRNNLPHISYVLFSGGRDNIGMSI
jgi:hypothetical protein